MWLHLLSDAKRTVGIFHIGDAESWDASRGEHVLTMEHVDLFLECHALDDGFNLGFVLQQTTWICLCLTRRH